MASSVIKNPFVASKNVSKTIKVAMNASRVEVSIYGKIIVVSYYFNPTNAVARGTVLMTMDLPSAILASSYNGGYAVLNDKSIYADKNLSANTDYLGQLVGVLA